MTSEKAFVAALLRAMRGAGVTQKTVATAMRAVKSTWDSWSIEERAAYQAATADLLPGKQLTVCYMDTWQDGADGDIFTGDHWRVTYRGKGITPRVEGVISKIITGGTYWAVTVSEFKYE